MGNYFTKIECSADGCNEVHPRYRMYHDPFLKTAEQLSGIKLTQEEWDRQAICPKCDAKEQKIAREIQERLKII